MSLRHLRKLDIQSCKKLESLSIEKFPVIEDLELLANNRELKSPYIIKCGTINSLQFLKKLPNLSLVYLEQTKVLDGYIPEFVRVF
jgi:hypothetical protein